MERTTQTATYIVLTTAISLAGIVAIAAKRMHQANVAIETAVYQVHLERKARELHSMTELIREAEIGLQAVEGDIDALRVDTLAAQQANSRLASQKIAFEYLAASRRGVSLHIEYLYRYLQDQPDEVQLSVLGSCLQMYLDYDEPERARACARRMSIAGVEDDEIEYLILEHMESHR